MFSKAAFPGLFLTLAGFLLFLLITLSTPIIKTIYFLYVNDEYGARTFNLGTFGGCTYNAGLSQCLSTRVGYILSYGQYEGANVFGLGYDVNNYGNGLANDLGNVFGGGEILWKPFTGALILNAITAGFAGISLIFALLAFIFSSRIVEIITFITLVLSSFIGFVAFWVDLAVVLVGRSRVNSYTNGAFNGHIGNAFWMALGGMIALILALCFTGCGMFGHYRKDRKERRAAEFDRENKFAPQRKRHFWQKRRAEPAPVMHQTTMATYPETTPYGNTAARV